MAQVWFVASGLAIGLLLFGRPRRLGPNETAPTDATAVRIVIPARNEAASLANLLGDLETGRPRDADVVVVDDRSTDGTGDIARSFPFVTVVRPDEPPTGWRGKPWACAAGAGHVDGLREPELLLFLDADVRVRPGAIDEVVRERTTSEGVVSVQPFHRTGTSIEQLSAVFNVVSMMGIGAGGDHPTGMFGPVVCCTLDDYRAVGGHAAVRHAVTEDVALAQRFLDHDIDVRVLAGADRVSFRMYPTGLGALIEGWTKNMATGAGTISPVRSLAVAWWVTAMLSSAVVPLDAATGGITLGGLAVYAAAAASLGAMLRRVGDFRWWVAALFPIPLLFFVVVFVRSAWCTYVRHSVTWRGRTIDLRESTSAVDPIEAR